MAAAAAVALEGGSWVGLVSSYESSAVMICFMNLLRALRSANRANLCLTKAQRLYDGQDWKEKNLLKCTERKGIYTGNILLFKSEKNTQIFILHICVESTTLIFVDLIPISPRVWASKGHGLMIYGQKSNAKGGRLGVWVTAKRLAYTQCHCQGTKLQLAPTRRVHDF